jgi:hypothetical protein
MRAAIRFQRKQHQAINVRKKKRNQKLLAGVVYAMIKVASEPVRIQRSNADLSFQIQEQGVKQRIVPRKELVTCRQESATTKRVKFT